MNMKTNFTNNSPLMINCVRCEKELTYSLISPFCLVCRNHNSTKAFSIPEGQRLDEHLFPIHKFEPIVTQNNFVLPSPV